METVERVMEAVERVTVAGAMVRGGEVMAAVERVAVAMVESWAGVVTEEEGGVSVREDTEAEMEAAVRVVGTVEEERRRYGRRGRRGAQWKPW